jgi:prepilin-type N-terminal cleavage/methylation domain-containing protein
MTAGAAGRPAVAMAAATAVCRSARRAFTLVEMLVVIAIIGTLVALLLPALQSARESGRRTACANNLKQLGLAVTAHESTHQVFPPAGRGYVWCYHNPAKGYVGDTQGYNSNGLVLLLPFLDQGALYDSFRHDEAAMTTWDQVNNTNAVHVGDAKTNGNAKAASTVLGAFICPTNGPPKTVLGSTYGTNNAPGGARTNYDFIVNSPIGMECNFWAVAGSAQRIFGENSATTPAHVRDGLSNTFIFGETSTEQFGNGNGLAWGYRAFTMFGIDPGGNHPGINLWHLPQHTHVNFQSPPYEPRFGKVRTWWSPAASWHPGGSHFVMGDGAVHFLSESTDGTTLEALAGMRDGQSAVLP